MKTVELIINLPTTKLNTTFTYMVPAQYEAEVLFGKRVLVNFGGRREEGFVVAEQQVAGGADLKPILKVLDTETVFDIALLDLARWMAETYLCPIATALSLMVPKILRIKKGTVYMAAIDELENEQLLQQGVVLNTQLLARLWEAGEISHRQALQYVSQAELLDLVESGYIMAVGTYQLGRRPRQPHTYLLGDFDFQTDLVHLQRRAPRQAAIMELLRSSDQLDEDLSRLGISPASLQALLSKGYLKIQAEPPRPQAGEMILSEDQQLVAARLREALHSGSSIEFLLFGVTGSGKTEVYVQAARTALQQGKGVLVLVPEIALTRQLVEVFAARLGDLAVLHSGLSAGERYEEWLRIKNGQARVVLGARSAVFAPLPRLGLIIMDEEQEGSYKQEELPRYHTREVARYRAQQESAVLVLGSATPSIETFHAAYTGTVQLLPLLGRIGGGQMPEVYIEDLKTAFQNDSRGLITPRLRDKIDENLNRGEQVILFINRRGYSPMTVCWECGNIASCPSCSVGMTYHIDVEANVCHYCNLHLPVESQCRACGSTHLQLMGAGTQRVEEHIRSLFPLAVVARLDIDSSRRKGMQKSILDGMKSGQIDILVGTQMVAKGLDFPAVSLVGIIDADAMLNLPDFRAGERCFQLLVQAAGRAGRSKARGEVIIQTFNPDHPIIKMAADQDYLSFYQYEVDLRRRLDYPPFTRLLRLVFSGEEEHAVQAASQTTAQFIEELIDASETEIILLGPASCPLNKIRNRFRYQLMVKCAAPGLLRSVAAYILARPSPKNVRIDLDFDPISSM
ncbi:MAG: primosomal protein N' [Syntrophomonas sp.]|nr:primosomal protein N' [Syntrophomonas sp.]